MTEGARHIAKESRVFTRRRLFSVLFSFVGCFVFVQASPLHASDEPAATHATRLILLGTAGGPGVVRLRSQPANLLVVDGTPYLIDAGEGVTRQLVLAGFQPVRMRTIFITHHHVDHDAGLEPLMSLEWFGRSFASSEAPTEIYGPPATKYLVAAALDYLSVSERIFRAGIPHMLPAKPMFEAHDINHDGVVFQDSNVKVTAVENAHFSFKSETPETGQDRSYAYRFDTKNGSVVFTGDTGPSRAVTKLAEGADVLVSEVRVPAPPTVTSTAAPPNPGEAPNPVVAELMNHLEHEHLIPEEVGKMAARAHVKVVILTHIAPSTETDMTKFTAGVKKYFSGVVIPGSDFLEYDLD